MRLGCLQRVHYYNTYNPFSNIDFAHWPAEVLKKSGAVPAEIIAGHQQIKPSQKAKHTASVNLSDEDEPNSAPEDKPVNSGSKCKAGKKASSQAVRKKQKPNEVPKTKQAHKRAHVDSEDVGSTDENASQMEDQADAYEQLRLKCKTDQLVCGEIKKTYW